MFENDFVTHFIFLAFLVQVLTSPLVKICKFFEKLIRYFFFLVLRVFVGVVRLKMVLIDFYARVIR